MKKLPAILAIALIAAVACAPALATKTPIVIESRLASGQNPLFTFDGLAPSGIASSAEGVPSGGGSYYCTHSLPSKYGDWLFNCPTTGYYDVYATWTANFFASGTAAPTWTVNSAGAPVSISLSQETGWNAWNLLAAGSEFNADSQYMTHLATNPDMLVNKRTYFDSVMWIASDPLPVTNGWVSNDGSGTKLTWAAGACDSSFDVFFGTDQAKVAGGDASVKVAANLPQTTLECDLGGENLAAGTAYYWMVQAKNLDADPVSGPVWAFTTMAVPEPGSLLGLGAGLLSLVGLIRRKRA